MCCYIRAAQFNFFEPKVGRYTYQPILEEQIKKYLIDNPIESLIDMEDDDYKSMMLFQLQRRGGQTATHKYSPLYLEVDVRAMPYRYLSLIRTKGAYWETILEVL